MKNFITKTMTMLLVMIGFTTTLNAQEKTENKNTLKQQMCYEKIVNDLGDFLTYPDEAYFDDAEGTVVVRFTTDEDNNIKNLHVLGKPNETLADEAMKAVHLMLLKNQNEYTLANSVYRIPISFEINE